MTRIIAFFAVTLLLLTYGCQSETKWEYLTIAFPSQGYDRTGKDAFKFASITPSEESLNKYGAEGWELVSAWLEMETAFPNFGDEKYVTGIQPNVRPQRVVMIFKRPLRKN